MYEFFSNNFREYIIEDSKELLVFLIPGKNLTSKLDWYTERRSKAFNLINTEKLTSDFEERDLFYTHMIIWDKNRKSLAGGQRFLFNSKGCIENKSFSYLENYHEGTYEKLKNESFCEIGRTFVMPDFKNKNILKELIRGFIKIPESRNISLALGLISFDHKKLNKNCVSRFLKILENSKTSFLDLPNGRYLYENFVHSKLGQKKYILNIDNLKKIKEELKDLDDKFEMPLVFKPYLRYCNISYENYSIAKEYNGLMQILCSGRSQDINFKKRKILEDYQFRKDSYIFE